MDWMNNLSNHHLEQLEEACEESLYRGDCGVLVSGTIDFPVIEVNTAVPYGHIWHTPVFERVA